LPRPAKLARQGRYGAGSKRKRRSVSPQYVGANDENAVPAARILGLTNLL